MVEYTYDAWGKPLTKTGTLATTLGTLNPFRYRGYVYDEETGLYYLRSRYYNPTWGRFLNADEYFLEEKVTTRSIFEYCQSNPINAVDPDGAFPVLFTSMPICPPLTIFEPLTIPAPIFPPLVGPFVGVSSKEAAKGKSEKAKPRYRRGSRGWYSRRKAAYEDAKRAGGGAEPKLHGPEGGKPPHYHPDGAKVKKFKLTNKMPYEHDHYYFPKSQFVLEIYSSFENDSQSSYKWDEEEDKKEIMPIMNTILNLMYPPIPS